MKSLLFLFLVSLSTSLSAQYSAAYSDDDLRAYLRISQSMIEYRGIKARDAKNKQEELGISREDMGATLDQLKKAGSWDVLKPQLEPNFAIRFEMLMNRACTDDNISTGFHMIGDLVNV